MNQRVAFFGLQELSYIGHADFQLEGRGDTIKRLDALACEVLAVLVQVNESRSDHQPAGMDDAASAQHLGRDAHNLSVADADVAHGIHAGFGIHDASAFEHEIVLLRGHNGGGTTPEERERKSACAWLLLEAAMISE